MKQLFAFLLFLLPVSVLAQGVAINNDGSAAASTAILDLKSNTKGLLIPRMTTLERTSIIAVVGLTVFDTETASYWMYRGDVNGGWAELQHNFQNFWSGNGTDAYNKNSGNIGIGTNSPGEKLTLNAPNATMQFMNSGTARGYLQVNGTDMKLGTYVNNTTGNIVFNTRAVDRMWISETGWVGIGTSTPTTSLTINGTNPVLQLRNGDVNKGFMLLNGDDMRIGTNSTNLTGNLLFQTKLNTRMTINENGQIGIGTTTPSSLLTLNGTDPILQMRNDGVDKGFMQLVGDDLRVGTNISNPDGKFIVRTNGVDRFTIDDDGYALLGNGSSGGAMIINGGPSGYLYLQGGGLTDGILEADGGTFDIHRGSPGILRVRASGDGMWFFPNGQVSVGGGGQTATGYVFSVEGKAIATEFRVASFGNWPDYVFSPTYRLMPLPELQQYIRENKHLPNIPAASVVEKEGISLGDMSKRLIEKVEELTLYVLQQQEQIDELKKQLQSKTKN